MKQIIIDFIIIAILSLVAVFILKTMFPKMENSCPDVCPQDDPSLEIPT